LTATRPPIARISRVQDRPSPATSSGWLAIARVSRWAARSRASPLPLAAEKKAIARASPSTVVAKFGAEQPSIP
jgi:hypothetical protein